MNTKTFILCIMMQAVSFIGLNAQTDVFKSSAPEKFISHISHEFLTEENIIGHDEISFDYKDGYISNLFVEWTEASETLGVVVKYTKRENEDIIDFKQTYLYEGYEYEFGWGSYYLSNGKIIKSEATFSDNTWEELIHDYTYDGDRLIKITEFGKTTYSSALRETSFEWDDNGNIPIATDHLDYGTLKIENTITNIRNNNGILNILFGGQPFSFKGMGGETISDLCRIYMPISLLCGTVPTNLVSDCIIKNDNDILIKRHYSYETDADGYVSSVKVETNDVLKDTYYITWSTGLGGIKETEVPSDIKAREYSVNGIQYHNMNNNICIKNGKKYLKL